MKQEYIKQIALDIVEAVTKFELPVPTSYQDYDEIVARIKKHHRATLTHNEVSATKDVIPLVHLLLQYESPVSGMYKLVDEYCNEHGFFLVLPDQINETTLVRKHTVTLICLDCEFTEHVTVASVIRRTGGCKKCSGKVPTYKDPEGLRADLLTRGFSLEEVYKEGKYYQAKITCNNCGCESHRTVAHLKYRNSTIYCEKCNPPPVYGKMGIRSEYVGINFDSDLELQTYKLLEPLQVSIRHHVQYTELGATDSLFECDFLVMNKYVLEVSSFDRKHHQSYHEKIALKQYLIEHHTEYVFVFCNSLAEVGDFIDTLKFIHN